MVEIKFLTGFWNNIGKRFIKFNIPVSYQIYLKAKQILTLPFSKKSTQSPRIMI